MSSTSPRYRQIEDYLLERILSGEFPVHHQIPPEEQLARDFGVSRMTANKAIRDLVQKGFLVRQAGQGRAPSSPTARSSPRCWRCSTSPRRCAAAIISTATT